MKILSVRSYFSEYDVNDFELEILANHKQPAKDYKTFYQKLLSDIYTCPINTYDQLIALWDDDWDQTENYIIGLGTELFEETQTIHWTYDRKHTDLVCDYLNSDYFTLADVSEFELENEISRLEFLAVEICSTFSDAIGHQQALEELESYLPEYRIRIEAVKNDISALNYHDIKDMVDKIFISSDEPLLSSEEKYYAYSNSFKNKTSRYPYTVSMHIGSEAKEPSDDLDDVKYRDLGELWDIDRRNIPAEQKYKLMCSHIKDRKIAVGMYENKSFSTLANCIMDMLFYLIRKNTTIKICPNCGRYFVPESRADTIYCTNKAPQDETKNCQEYGKYINYLTKTRNDEATKLYKQIFNQKRNKVQRCKTAAAPEGNPALNADFEAFQKAAKVWKSDIKIGARTEAEYIEWLRAVKEKKVL